MEPRKVTVVQTKGQGKTVFMSGAENLSELKSDLRENKISFEDMIFYEGISRTELVDDLSILPKNIPFKGQVTNELVIYLTVKNKKIRSGMGMTRSEAYVGIKANNLGDVVKSKYGKNFTQVSTSELEEIILANTAKVKPVKTEPVEAETVKTEAAPVVKDVKTSPVTDSTPVEAGGENCSKAITHLLEILESKDVISEDEKQNVLGILKGDAAIKPVKAKVVAKLASSFSDRELDELAPKY
jgi:hypothetical protein